MAQVFVANGTRQHRVFCYRVVERMDLRTLEIPAGRQNVFQEDFEGPGLDYLINQLEQAGAINVSEIGSITLPDSFIFSVSKNPIKSDKIDEAGQKDMDARQERSAKKSEEAGLTTFRAVQGQRPDGLNRSTLTVEEMQGPGEDVKRDGVSFETVVDTKATRRRVDTKRKR